MYLPSHQCPPSITSLKGENGGRSPDRSRFLEEAILLMLENIPGFVLLCFGISTFPSIRVCFLQIYKPRVKQTCKETVSCSHNIWLM